MKMKSLLTWLCVLGSSIGLSASADSPSRSPGHSAWAERGARNATLPLEAQYAVSAALGRDQTAYHFIPRSAGVAPNREPLNHAETSYQAANPNQHFNARFDAQGASVVSAGTHWNLSVQAWGYGDQDYGIENIPTLREVGAAAPFVSANRVEYRRGTLTEWYVNGPLGLQQGFTVNAPPARRSLGTGGPASRGPLTFVLNMLDGEGHSQMDADRAGLTLLTDKSGPALRYSGLTALDADGMRLPAWLETRENKLLLCVDDTKARYPIVIDPFIQQAKLTAADGAASDLFGISVALSDDGNTAIAGAYGADKDGNNNQGAAYVFTRSSADWTQQTKLTAADGTVGDYFGYSVALSGDGNTVIVGANGTDVGGNVNQGAAYMFAALLPPTGVAASYDFYIDRVQVTWDAAAAATGYEVWRGASNDTSQATNIGTGISGTNYDDMAAFVGMTYYYWVKTTNANGASAFSASAIGRVLLGPDVRLNGAAGPVTMAVGSQLVVTVSINPTPMYLSIPADWWVLYYPGYGIYYLNSGLTWSWASTFFSIQPVYQGFLFGLQSAVVLDTTFLPTGTHTFYFGIDMLNGFLDSFVIYDSATVTVAP